MANSSSTTTGKALMATKGSLLRLLFWDNNNNKDDDVEKQGIIATIFDWLTIPSSLFYHYWNGPQCESLLPTTVHESFIRQQREESISKHDDHDDHPSERPPKHQDKKVIQKYAATDEIFTEDSLAAVPQAYTASFIFMLLCILWYFYIHIIT